MRAQLKWEELIPNIRTWKPNKRWPAVLQRPATYVGPPESLPSGLNPHTLTIAIPVSNPTELQSVTADEIVEEIWGYIQQLSIVASPEFLRDWVLVFGSAEKFEASGIMLTAPDRKCSQVRAAVAPANLVIPLRKTKPGAQAYGELEELAHKLVGAQLYKLDRMLQGAMNHFYGGRHRAPSARSVLAIHLEPFGSLTRGGQSDLGKVYERLITLGRDLINELHAHDVEHCDASTLARNWKTRGNQLAITAKSLDDILPETPALSIELQLLHTCVDIAHRAHRLHTQGFGPLRFRAFYPGSRVSADINVSTQDAILGRSGSAFPVPSFLYLTELSYRYGFNPAAYYPVLSPLDLHFVCAQLVGNAHRGVPQPVVPAWEYWGLKGLVRSVHDGWLGEELRQSRALLRARLTPRLLKLSELSGVYEADFCAEDRPMWCYRPTIRR